MTRHASNTQQKHSRPGCHRLTKLLLLLPMRGVCFAYRLIQVCLAYSQRHPSTAADDLAVAALNLLALAVPVVSDGLEGPAVALMKSMVQARAGSEALQSSSLLDQLKASWKSPLIGCGCRRVKHDSCLYKTCGVIFYHHSDVLLPNCSLGIIIVWQDACNDSPSAFAGVI